MVASRTKLILGEFRRAVDDRYRLSIPPELMAVWGRGLRESPISGSEPQTTAGAGSDARSFGHRDRTDVVLAKERPGCLSLWLGRDWQDQVGPGIRVVESKLRAGRLGDRLTQVQTLGRLMSTRQRPIQLAGRGRLVIPEGFREFLGVKPGTEVLVVGAAVCIEIWETEAWRACLQDEIPRFGRLLDELSG